MKLRKLEQAVRGRTTNHVLIQRLTAHPQPQPSAHCTAPQLPSHFTSDGEQDGWGCAGASEKHSVPRIYLDRGTPSKIFGWSSLIPNPNSERGTKYSSFTDSFLTSPFKEKKKYPTIKINGLLTAKLQLKQETNRNSLRNDIYFVSLGKKKRRDELNPLS